MDQVPEAAVGGDFLGQRLDVVGATDIDGERSGRAALGVRCGGDLGGSCLVDVEQQERARILKARTQASILPAAPVITGSERVRHVMICHDSAGPCSSHCARQAGQVFELDSLRDAPTMLGRRVGREVVARHAYRPAVRERGEDGIG